jgi:hypothetical protein
MKARMYDPKTEINLKGTVEAMTQGTRGQMMGIHLTVKAEDETRQVMSGPSRTAYRRGPGAEWCADAQRVKHNRLPTFALEIPERNASTVMSRKEMPCREWQFSELEFRAIPRRRFSLYFLCNWM